MELVALVVGGLVLVGLAAFANRDTPARQEKQRWATAARNLGLTGGVGSLEGRLDGIDVAVRITEPESRRPGVEAIGTPDKETRVSVRQWKEGLTRDGAVKTGDKAFDKAFVVRGEAPLVRAALGPGVRRDLLSYAAGRDLQVTRGAVQMQVLGAAEDLARIQSVVRETAALAAALCIGPDEVRARVAANFRNESSAKTRNYLLEQLIADHPDTEETQAAIEQALSDRSAQVRTTAALSAGPAGTPALEEIVADPDAPYQLRDRASFQLSKHVAVGRVKALLAPYLVDGHPMRKQAVEQMIARGCDPGLGPLMTMLRSDDPDEICVGARCVGAHGYKQAEVTLVQLVDHGDTKVRVGVVHALGQVGTKRALGILKETTKDPSSARLRRAASEAVRRIEARATTH